jgi:hypothetical protein
MKPKAIRANDFVLEDENGTPRVLLAVGKKGLLLALVDENGQVRATLAGTSGRGLFLFDETARRSGRNHKDGRPVKGRRPEVRSRCGADVAEGGG